VGLHRSPDQQAERDAYELQLRRLHEERQYTHAAKQSARDRGEHSSRLW